MSPSPCLRAPSVVPCSTDAVEPRPPKSSHPVPLVAAITVVCRGSTPFMFHDATTEPRADPAMAHAQHMASSATFASAPRTPVPTDPPSIKQ